VGRPGRESSMQWISPIDVASLVWAKVTEAEADTNNSTTMKNEKPFMSGRSAQAL
jgi:hypothetical protein